MARFMSLRLMTALFTALLIVSPIRSDEPAAVKETALQAPGGVSIKVRMEGPYTADVPLQIVCYFKFTVEGTKRMNGAPVELDKHLGGVIAALRERGEFEGNELETILLDVPEGTIPAKKLLLIGLGEEAGISLEKLERVGRIALRESLRIGVTKAAFAPLIRDQGNKAIPAGDVETAVTRGLLLAHDTEQKLHKQGFSKARPLTEWIVEAGPAYYDETVTGVRKGVTEANEAITRRSTQAYSTKSK